MDLAAAIFVLVDRCKPSRERESEVYAALTGALSNGYTYQAIHDKILEANYQNTSLDFSQFSRRVVGNLLDGSGKTRYYHPELTIHNTLSPVIVDINAGTHVNSKENVFWVEPRASYTLDDLYKYFKLKVKVDEVDFKEGRVRGILTHMVQDKTLEVTLFMIDAVASALKEDTKRGFDIRFFEECRPKALEMIECVKENCSYSGGAGYVYRPRVLFG